jgi:hypothetical protein
MARNSINRSSGGGSGGAVPYADLATNVNKFMTGEAIAPYLQNLPGYANMVGQRSENTQQMLEGQLPQDVINQIMQQAAERGIAGGAPSSDSSNAAYLKALGLNSLGMMQQGSQNLSQSIADTPVPELWNPMALHVPVTLGNMELSAARAGMGAGAGGGGGGGVSGLTKSPSNYRDPGVVVGNSWSNDITPHQYSFTSTAPAFTSPSFSSPTPQTSTSGSNWLQQGGWATPLGGGLGSSLFGSSDDLLRAPTASAPTGSPSDMYVGGYNMLGGGLGSSIFGSTDSLLGGDMFF